MKKLFLSVTCLLLTIFLAVSPLYSATSHKKKNPAKKKHQVSTTTRPSKTKSSKAAKPTEKAERNHGFPREQLVDVYTYGRKLYAAKEYDKAKENFKKLILVATDEDLSSNSLYIYSQCAFQSEDFMGCVKALTILAERWPDCPMIKGGYVKTFCVYVINKVADLQTNWDYFRYVVRYDEKDLPVWRESIPPGPKIKRINFRLGFGLYNVLKLIQPNSTETVSAQQKLDHMINAPITMLWVDEKAPPNKWGHPADFFSILSTIEKKEFSKVICDRMFFDWQSEKLYQFMVMYDDVRNLKPRFVARTKPPAETPSGPATLSPPVTTPPPAPGTAAVTPMSPEADPNVVLTLSKLFDISGYNPYDDTFTNAIEKSPIDLSL